MMQNYTITNNCGCCSSISHSTDEFGKELLVYLDVLANLVLIFQVAINNQNRLSI